MPRSTSLLIVSILAALAGCEETGIRRTDGGAPPMGEDGGEAVARQLSYTPEGCGYEVSTPEVTSTAMGADVFDEASPELIEHVHVSWAGPSDTSFAVNWKTASGTLSTHVLYGTDRDAVDAAEEAGGDVMAQAGHTLLYRPDIGRGGTRVHETHVCGLEPDTTYFYKVGGPGHWSRVYETATAPPVGSTSPFSFGVSGDSRNNLENSWPTSQRAMLEAGVDFEVFSGDAVFLGPNQNDWREFFDATVDDFGIEDLFSRAPFMMANGNHDQLAVNYVAQFAYPQELTEGERAQGEEWYSFDYGNAHFVMLNDTVADSAVLGGAQADWMRRDLMQVDRTEQPWIFVTHHRPFYTCRSTHSPDTALRAAWQPIFDEFSVDFVLTGHNHVYERTVPIRNLEGGEGVVAPQGPNAVPTYDPAGLPSGTVYVVAAGVGAELYEVSTECGTSFIGEASRPYILIEIEDRTLTYTAYNAMTGAVIDSFTLEK